jgi:hypothetical protein
MGLLERAKEDGFRGDGSLERGEDFSVYFGFSLQKIWVGDSDRLEWGWFNFDFWEKYNLAPQSIIDSPNGTPNYQSLDFGPLNYLTLVFRPLPSG